MACRFRKKFWHRILNIILMKTDFSKNIVCNDGLQREFHFARINSAAIYFHVSVIDVDGKLLTATMLIDDSGQWRMQTHDFPEWFNSVEPKLARSIAEAEG